MRRLLHDMAVCALFGIGAVLAQEAPAHAEDLAATTLEEITVTAVRVEEYISNHPQLVEVIGRREIDERNLATVEEALKTLPGVDVSQGSGSGSRVSIRGSGRSSGVLVLVDGRPLNSNQYGRLDLNTVPVDQVESITVFKPPVPVWLGPGGSDGAINIVTRIPPAADKSNDPRTTCKLRGGSYGLVAGSLSRMLELFDGTAQVTVSANHRDGKRRNSDRDTASAAVNWSRQGAQGVRYALSGRYYDSEYGCAGPTDNPTPAARQHYRKGSLEGRYVDMLGENGTLETVLYGDLTTLRDRSQSGFVATLDECKAGLKADTTWTAPDESWEGRLGVLSEWNTIDQTLTGEHERFRNSLSGQYDRRFAALTTTIGLRGDVTNDYGIEPGFTAGIGWGVNEKVLIKISGGYTVNVPTFGQLYQTAHGSIDQTRGNADLDEERIWSYDLGIEYRPTKDALFQITLFRTDSADLISYQRGGDLIYRPMNIADAWREGIELTGKSPLCAGLSSETSLIVQHSENSATGQQLPYTPKVKIKQTLRYSLPGQKTRLEGTLRYEGRRYSQVENRAANAMGAFATLDLKASRTFTLRGVNCDGYVTVENLFDRRYQAHYGYPDDGIRVIAGVQARF